MNVINISTNRRNLYYTYKYLFEIFVQLKALDFADSIKYCKTCKNLISKYECY